MNQHDHSTILTAALAGILSSMAAGTIFGVPAAAVVGGTIGAVCALICRETRDIPMSDKFGILIVGIGAASGMAETLAAWLTQASISSDLRFVGFLCGFFAHVALPEMARGGRALAADAIKRARRLIGGGK